MAWNSNLDKAEDRQIGLCISRTWQRLLAVLSHFSHLQVWATLWKAAHQALLSMGFSRQEYWSGPQCPPPGDLPDPGIEHGLNAFPAVADSLSTTSTIWKAQAKLTGSFFLGRLFNKLAVFNCICKKHWFCSFKGKKQFYFNQFAPESKEYHGHPASKNVIFPICGQTFIAKI